MIRMAAYCRVSTNKYDQLNSLAAQKEFFEEYARRNNYTLVKIYADEGISGTKTKNREQFLQLMSDSNDDIFDMVAVKDISRLSRNAVDFLQSIRVLKDKGIPCNFVTSNLTTESGEMLLGVLALVAQEESGNTSKRIKFSKRINAEKGRVPNIVYGYNKVAGEYFDLSINELEAQIVRRIYDLYTNDGYGANKIAQILNREGAKTKRDFKWSQNAICRILTNELYTGKIINGKQEIVNFLTGIRKKRDESEWFIVNKPELRIIEDDIFVRAAKLLEQRCNAFNINHERQSNKHLYSTLIKCACCGYSFRRTERCYQNTYIKWVCSGRNAHGVNSCNNLSKIDEQELTDAIKTYFTNILNNKKNVINNIVTEFDRIYHSKDDNADNEKELRKRMEKATKSRKKYMEMYEDELITREELQEKVSALNIEVNKCTSELEHVDRNISKGDQLERVLHNTFKDLESILSMEHMTNAQLKRVIDRIAVDEHGKIDIYLKPLSDIGIDQTVLVSVNCT